MNSFVRRYGDKFFLAHLLQISKIDIKSIALST